MEAVSDEIAIEHIRKGHIHAYEVLLRRYNQRLFRVARSILQDSDAAQDAVQEAYITAYFKLDSYVSCGSFGAWLTRITVNEALMIKRKPDNRKADNRDNMDSVSQNTLNDNPFDTLSNLELAGLLEVAIDALPDDFRTVFVLRSVQQLSVRETAKSLDIPEATVKTRFHRARKLMQDNLNQHIEAVGLHVFEFAGERCDRIVQTVIERIGVKLGSQFSTNIKDQQDKLH